MSNFVEIIESFTTTLNNTVCAASEGITWAMRVGDWGVNSTIKLAYVCYRFLTQGANIETINELADCINYILLHKLCISGLIYAISLLKSIISKSLLDSIEVYMEMAAKIIVTIFGEDDIQVMVGYLGTDEKIKSSISEKIDTLLEIAEQIIIMITTNKDALITLPPCLEKKIETAAYATAIQDDIEKCSKSLKNESIVNNKKNREGYLLLLNKFKPDVITETVDESNEKRMKLILLIVLVMESYKIFYTESLTINNNNKEDMNRIKTLINKNKIVDKKGGKSRRVKSRRNKSRRNKSRRVKSRRTRK
jgi:hypothetical protein